MFLVQSRIIHSIKLTAFQLNQFQFQIQDEKIFFFFIQTFSDTFEFVRMISMYHLDFELAEKLEFLKGFQNNIFQNHTNKICGFLLLGFQILNFLFVNKKKFFTSHLDIFFSSSSLSETSFYLKAFVIIFSGLILYKNCLFFKKFWFR